tara:strand:+ start:310 stop:495 length:186 start_codon:yes stop_codon:yes gene_type:complete
MNQDQLDLYREILPIQRQRLEDMKNDLENTTNFVRKTWLSYQINKLEAWIIYYEKLVRNND